MEKDKKIDEFEELLSSDDNLTDKERMFCLNYLRHFNAAKSYRESFGETKFDKQAAHLLLKKEKISNYIQKLKKELFTYRIAIECDGKAFHSSKKAKARDRKRDAYLRSIGWKTLRFSGSTINGNMSKVISRIESEIQKKHSIT
ncbi:DUF559 domain-containing protein [Peribacillus simplex]|uniref:DUF559 domain-containing protein n=1 Tax=Peribacillus simplex TaxID=1478 RepID=A0A8B5Y4E4_9BACI|nr:terminase small subunit [Peribacillus simplex]TVX83694.1 DUF559 domain-containing protein [Peribacillus simplex]